MNTEEKSNIIALIDTLEVEGRIGLSIGNEYKQAFKDLINGYENLVLLGKYDGSTFEGSDRLGLHVSVDFKHLKRVFDRDNLFFIAEGERLTNRPFFNTFNPIVLKINGDGELGRKERKSNQSERQLKSIKTRVSDFKFDVEFNNSNDCLIFIEEEIWK